MQARQARQVLRQGEKRKTIQNLLNDLLNNPCKDNPQFAKIASKLPESDKALSYLL